MIDRAMINKLDVETAKITYASIKELDVVKENAEEINAKKANIDLANVNNAWIEKGVLKDGSIGSAAIHEGAVTNAKIADATIEAAKIKSINADSIVAGTIKTERLIITGPDGQDSIVKAINIANGVSEAEVNGQKIQAASIDVVDLSAFQAKIAQFDMSQNAIYSGKLAINDPTSGVYISTTGLGLGDGALTSKKESPIQMYADGVFKLKGNTLADQMFPSVFCYFQNSSLLDDFFQADVAVSFDAFYFHSLHLPSVAPAQLQFKAHVLKLLISIKV